jgi:hypothetical protein
MHLWIKNLSLSSIEQFLGHLVFYLKELLLILLIALLAIALISIITKLIRLIRHLREPFLFLEITPPSNAKVPALSTTQLFNQIFALLKQGSFKDRLFFRDASASFEIVSSKKEGIRYLVRVSKSRIGNIEKAFRAYLPSCKIKQTDDYLGNRKNDILEFKQTKHFALPLHEHNDLSKHDPISYLTGSIKQLNENDLLALQIVVTPMSRSGNHYQQNESRRIKSILRNRKHLNWSQNNLGSRIAMLVVSIINSLMKIVMIPFFVVAEFLTSRAPEFPNQKLFSDEPTPADLEYSGLAKSKLSEPLFSAAIRVLVSVENKQTHERASGIIASVNSFTHACGQSLTIKRGILNKLFLNWKYLKRIGGINILTTAETGSIFHFPFADDVYNDDMQKIRSRELPAPLSVKNQNDFDVVFGKNTYSNSSVHIGLTDDDRSRHVYMIGQTGSGKTTIIYHMASDDINKGRGVAVVDPHGDLAEDLLNRVPDSRIDDLIYLNPFDIKYPIGINLLELSQGLDEDDLELEKELVCESVVAIFRRVFFKDENVDAHRIEYILRNAIYSAFCQEDCTIFTVYDLLNNKDYRKQAIKNITDKNLMNFWKNEFGKAGDYQLVKMTSGVTSKIGRFLFSPIARRILEQPKSTISFDDILDQGKILICNLAEGKLGEDTSQLLGATIIAKIYQAAMRRVRVDKEARSPFYMFVDEFQNFATSSFTKVLSGGRKFGLRITIAEQSTAQQKDKNIVNVVLANTGTAICFRTASPVDESLILPQFAPAVGPGDIANLPRFRFYIKMAAIEPEEPFSGITLPILTVKQPKRIEKLIEASRNNYAIKYTKTVDKNIQRDQKPEKTKTEPATDIGSLT